MIDRQTLCYAFFSCSSTHLVITLPAAHSRRSKAGDVQNLEAVLGILARLSSHLNRADDDGVSREDAVNADAALKGRSW